MELWVLGCHTPYAPPEGACSGYLIRSGHHHVLIDCGSGVLARSQHILPLSALNTVILTHLHGDHRSDIFSLQYGAAAHRRMGLRQPTVAIYAPPEPEEIFATLSYGEVTEGHALTPDTILRRGPLTCTFAVTQHGVQTFAVRISDGIHTIAFTADTGYTETLLPLLHGADLLLAEATLPEVDRGHPGHMSASEAGRLARRAAVKRLLLTHVHPQTRERDWVQRARRHFGGPVALAQSGCLFRLS